MEAHRKLLHEIFMVVPPVCPEYDSALPRIQLRKLVLFDIYFHL